ncbi:MAG: DUF354 domain-containing protein [Anaerolineae bacterium]|nr:DUF354 domain-containing protein [Anaerolineae bacterium]
MANILIDVGHPAHVHLFRLAAGQWEAAGHRILFTALDREAIVQLLQYYQLPHQVIYKRQPGRWRLIRELIVRTWRTLLIAGRFKPDLFVSMGSPTMGLPAWLLRKPYIALTDTEHAREQHALFKPFASLILTPSIFTVEMGPKQVRYAANHELMYLHPEVFTPDVREIESLGLRADEPYFMVRFVAWGATHDIGERGFSGAEKRALVQALAQRGRVLLSVESGEVEAEFAPLVTTFPPEKVHHLLAFATLYIGEGATMASEAAVLGTPSIYVSTLTMGVQEDEQRYGLLFMIKDGKVALDKVLELLETPNLKAIWQERRAKMLTEKISPVSFMVELGQHLLENPHYRPQP